jgi:hypothetical protein
MLTLHKLFPLIYITTYQSHLKFPYTSIVREDNANDKFYHALSKNCKLALQAIIPPHVSFTLPMTDKKNSDNLEDKLKPNMLRISNHFILGGSMPNL